MSDDFPDPRRAERLARAAQAAHTLSETLWEALQEELSDPRSQRVAELSEQLGEVVAIVASLARVDAGVREAPVAPSEPEPEPRIVVARVTHDGPLAQELAPSRESPSPESPSRESPSRESPKTQAAPSPAVLVDELAPAEPKSVAESPAGARPQFEPSRPGAEAHLRAEGRLAHAEPEIAIRDVRGEDGPAAWIGSIGRRLERYEQDGSPFAVLLIELVDIERLRHAEPLDELPRLTSQVEDALARGLRPADSLTCERPGRYWLLAPQTDATGAQLLTERIARAVKASASHRGTPLEVAIGIAVCPDDGRQASTLAAHADVGLYAARAVGRTVTEM